MCGCAAPGERSYQVIDGARGWLRNRVDLHPLLRISARARCAAASDTRTDVAIAEAGFVLGEGRWPQAWTLPLPTAKNTGGYVDWLYLDESLRITRGSKGSLFVHVRDSDDVADAAPQSDD
ncbi:uncharacterized protein HaLaN_28884 [Haematococcus lacustris]|uniref:Plastid lipid-associated protein/fibrillin conserved domain-containing protein n=1 Tax=Haematococcus lacustris TaxID=44745 RepID=A0A6A0AB64_HAELA|nr:uncharacterized protein HaLaN_28884 [Haematococcus lacustris]